MEKLFLFCDFANQSLIELTKKVGSRNHGGNSAIFARAPERLKLCNSLHANVGQLKEILALGALAHAISIPLIAPFFLLTMSCGVFLGSVH